jgi:hypothetical protein
MDGNQNEFIAFLCGVVWLYAFEKITLEIVKGYLWLKKVCGYINLKIREGKA